jgi:SAM-dependent methyltransferase
VLDLCCGTGGITDVLSEWVGPTGSVVGADIDREKLAHARNWAAKNKLPNVEFVEADAMSSGFTARPFDLVHTRFAISVIRNGLAILDHMLALVRPSGIVFIEEPNTHTMQCFPKTEDWDRALSLMKDTFRVIGANTEIGSSLRGVLLEKGLVDLKAKPCLYALTCADPMTMHLPLTLASMSDTVASLGLMAKDDLQSLVKRVADHLAKPETMTLSFTMLQILGRMAA